MAAIAVGQLKQPWLGNTVLWLLSHSLSGAVDDGTISSPGAADTIWPLT